MKITQNTNIVVKLNGKLTLFISEKIDRVM